MFKCLLFRKYEWDHADYLKTVLCRSTLDDPHAVLTQQPLLQVIRSHIDDFFQTPYLLSRSFPTISKEVFEKVQSSDIAGVCWCW